MKTNSMKIVALLIPFFLLGCAQEHDKEQVTIEQTTVATVIDVTDPRQVALWPKAYPILALYHCDKFPASACKFSLSVISNLKTNPSYSVYMPTEAETEKRNTTDDAQWRKKQILKFYDSVSSVIEGFYTLYDTSKSLPYSECWGTVVKQLKELSRQPGTRKVLLLFSDLQEKGYAGNAYTTFKTMSISQIKNALEKQITVDEQVTNIKVIVVYQPKDREDDARFSKMYQVYKELLEQKGVIVTQQSKNDFFN